MLNSIYGSDFSFKYLNSTIKKPTILGNFEKPPLNNNNNNNVQTFIDKILPVMQKSRKCK